MNTWCRNVVIGLTVLVGSVTLGTYSQSGELSEDVGSVGDLLKKGYKFAAGSALGVEERLDVAVNERPPYTYSPRKSRSGTLYLQKGDELLVCNYLVVLVNPSFHPAGPGSNCYKIK